MAWYRTEYYFTLARSRVQNNKKIQEIDKEAILGLVNKLTATKLGKRRAIKYLDDLRLMLERDYLPSYFNVKESSLYHCLTEIEHNPTFGALTKRDYKIALKRMLEYTNNPLSEQIKTSSGKDALPRFFLTVTDILRMVNVKDRPFRDRAMAACFYESNCRPHEFFNLKKNDVRFDVLPAKIWDGNGGMLKVQIEVAFLLLDPESKTGARNPPIIFSVPFLKTWLKTRKDNSEYLWIGIRHPGRDKQIEYPAAIKALRQLAQSAEINQWNNVTLYSFRHGRNTELCKYLSYAVHCEHAGWRQGSDMPRVYNHIAGCNLIKPMLSPFGIVVDTLEDEKKTWFEIMRIGAGALSAYVPPKT